MMMQYVGLDTHMRPRQQQHNVRLSLCDLARDPQGVCICQ